MRYELNFGPEPFQDRELSDESFDESEAFDNEAFDNESEGEWEGERRSVRQPGGQGSPRGASAPRQKPAGHNTQRPRQQQPQRPRRPDGRRPDDDRRPGRRPSGGRPVRPPFGPAPEIFRWGPPYIYPSYPSSYPQVAVEGSWYREGNNVVLMLDGAGPPEPAAAAPPEATPAGGEPTE